jgi:hypothetical protein
LRIESYPESLIALLYRALDNLKMLVCYELCTIICLGIQAKRQNKVISLSDYFFIVLPWAE